MNALRFSTPVHPMMHISPIVAVVHAPASGLSQSSPAANALAPPVSTIDSSSSRPVVSFPVRPIASSPAPAPHPIDLVHPISSIVSTGVAASASTDDASSGPPVSSTPVHACTSCAAGRARVDELAAPPKWKLVVGVAAGVVVIGGGLATVVALRSKRKR